MANQVQVRHATLKANLASIQAHGLLAAKSKQNLKACWLHSPGKSAWAVLHVIGRHKVVAQDVVVLTFSVPRRLLRKSGKKGLWHTPAGVDVPARCITGVLTFEDLSKSPVEE